MTRLISAPGRRRVIGTFTFFINFRITRSGNHGVIVARDYDGSASMKSGTLAVAYVHFRFTEI